MKFDPRLYLILERSLIHRRSIGEVVLDLVSSGVTMVQLRDKSLSDDDMVSLGRELKQRLEPFRVPLIINDRVLVAKRVGAAGVHLGQSDEKTDFARRVLGRSAIIGLSCETMEQARAAQSLSLQYVSASPVFVSPTKHDIKAPWGIDGLKTLRSSTRLPIVAIGGIDESNLISVIEAGADGVALASGLLNHPLQKASKLRELIDQAVGSQKSSRERDLPDGI